MNNSQMIETAVSKSIQYEKDYHGCAQCVLGGIMDAFQVDAPTAFRATTGFSGGMGCTGRTCGALTGAIVSIGLFVGRDHDNMADIKRLRWENFALVKELIERYEAAYGSLDCRTVQERVVGIGVDLWNPEQAARFRDAEGHIKCAEGVVGQVARWTSEIILSYLERAKQEEH
ncbi:C_GCAxxG_C_C family protein [Candidatus Bipolaricaulota bacterium]|nr:C_GCAxxG_C_C family protein [Candidatus Bipolaricaulota bacterium]